MTAVPHRKSHYVTRLLTCIAFACLTACSLPDSLTQINEPVHESKSVTSPTPAASSTFEPLPELTPTGFPLTPEPIFTPVPTLTPQVLFGVSNFPPEINPLTGLPVKNLEKLNRRPVTVKVSNSPRNVRPQPGLSFADLVFEYAIGYFQTRFLALFYGQDAERTGPIRSGRLVDAQLVPMFQGFLIYGNADVQVDEILDRELGRQAVPIKYAPCPPVCGRDTHSQDSLDWVFADTARFSEFAANKGIENSRPTINGFKFNSSPPGGDLFAVKLGIEHGWITRSEWEYDPRTRKYLLSYETAEKKDSFPMAKQADPLTGRQVAFDNIVILFATYVEYAPSLHDIMLRENTTGMRAVLLRDGELVELSWYTIHPHFPLRFINPDGTPAAFKPGNTWFVIVGKDSSLEQVQPGRWEVGFKMS